MGRWTPNYLDSVLHAKISTLVTGAIQRAALDKSEPSITYENFVNDLDTGDSFTTTFIDILVKEMAERHARPTVSDRSMIADRTAKSLQHLATSPRIYRERPGRAFARRTVNLSDYLSAPPNEMDVEDDDEDLDTVLDSRVFSSSPSPPAEESAATIRAPSVAGRHNSWSLSNPASSSNLRRQPSIRLSSRSRTADFNDFTSRRRTSTRDSLSAGPEGNEGSSESREREIGRPRPLTRRFFPFGRSRPHEPAVSASLQDGEAQGGDGADEGFTYIFEPSVSGAAWVPLTSAARSASPDHHESSRHSRDTNLERVRRLRRGTIRAPESMFSRYEARLERPMSEEEDTAHAILTATRSITVVNVGRAMISQVEVGAVGVIEDHDR
ncbi:hypothetical protein AX14_002035 [Amanita brunnescens Koide BX004]|nr:hypothetical protein AX14_002035 [Amanita brunnescens Koide BX004]